MGDVKINRELLTDVVDALVEYHQNNPCRCQVAVECVVAQRIRRAQGALARDRFRTSAAPV